MCECVVVASCGPDLGLVNEFAQVCMVADDAVLLIEGKKASAQLLTSGSKIKNQARHIQKAKIEAHFFL